MKHMKKFLALSLAVVTAIGISGCGGTDSSSTTGTEGAGSDAQTATETSTGSATSSDNALNIMIEVEVESLDPQIATDGTSFEVIADFTDGLKQMDADGNPIDALCASEEVSDDGLTYTFTIRDDAYWSNGDPVTAADFVFGWQRAVDPATAAEYAYMMSDIGQIKNAAEIIAGNMDVTELGVTAIDDKTLQVELEVPVSYFDELLYFPTFYPVNQAFYESCGDTYATSPDTLLSNGAFIMTSYEPAATSFTLEKNPDYYDADSVSLDGLNYQVLKDSQQALLSYQNGDLDIIQLAGDQVDQVEDDPEFVSVAAGYLWYISPNIDAYPELANLNMRMALTYALDRETIVNSVVKDGSTASFAPVPSGLAVSSSGEDFTNDGDFSDVCAYDTTKAQEYFEKAKEELGQDTFTFEMVVDDTEVQQNVAAVIQAEIQDALPGVTIEIVVEPKKQRVEDMQEGNFCLGLTRWGPDYADPMTYLGMWVTDNANNYGLWSNSEFDSLIAECTTGDLNSDADGRWEAMKQAAGIVMDEAVIFPLYEQCNADMIKSNVSGIEFHPVALNRVYKNATKN
jgi:oligopeptide transport system substrate-binding protein